MITFTLTEATAFILIAVCAVFICVLQIKQQLNNIVENGIVASTEMQITDDDIRNIVDLILEEVKKTKEL